MNEGPVAKLRAWAEANTMTAGVTCVLTVTLGLYLLTQHTAHLLGALPYALILLCPLMHFLMPGMHGGHSGHGSHNGHDRQDGHLGPDGPGSGDGAARESLGSGGDHQSTSSTAR
jgi:hypothetical protein